MIDEHDTPATGTLDAARAHARSREASALHATITVPPTAAVDLPAGVESTQVVWDELVPAHGYASRRLPTGTLLRIDDHEGGACVALVLHRADQPAERLNVADTVKVQWQAYPGEGTLLLSGMGRVLASLVEDSGGRHDALCGCTNRGSVPGTGPWTSAPSTRDLLCLGLLKQGLTRRDLPANVNLFAAVEVLEDGRLVFDPAAVPGAHVVLRAEMDLIVTLANTPHPLDERDDPQVTPVRCCAWRPDPATDTAAGDDPIRSSTPERRRAFLNTEAELAVTG